jgi:arsenate reductase
MSSPLLNILFLCTGNSARSIIAEGILRKKGGSDFQAYSAGSQPAGQPNPYALVVLRNHDIDTAFARSKRWDIFADPTGLKGDLIITACDNAAGETCPVWPSHPSSAHWGVADPAAIRGSYADIATAFQATYREMTTWSGLPKEANPTSQTIGSLARSIGQRGAKKYE